MFSRFRTSWEHLSLHPWHLQCIVYSEVIEVAPYMLDTVLCVKSIAVTKAGIVPGLTQPTLYCSYSTNNF